MNDDVWRKRGYILLSSALCVLLQNLSFLGVFFLLPLQLMFVRQGKSSFLMSSAIALAGLVAVKAAMLAVAKESWSMLAVLEVGFPMLIVVGLIVLNVLEDRGWRFLYRLVAVVAIAGAIVFPFLAWLLAQESFVTSLQKGFDGLYQQVIQNSGLDTKKVVLGLSSAEYFKLLKEVFLSSFFLLFFFYWSITWKLGNVLGGSREDDRGLKGFFVPPSWVWVILGVWGVMLARSLLARFQIEWNWGWGDYVLFNVAIVMWAIYALSGWGVLSSLLERGKVPKVLQVVLKALVVLSLFMQGSWLQGAVMIGLPLLSVLELWVNLRKREQRG